MTAVVAIVASATLALAAVAVIANRDAPFRLGLAVACGLVGAWGLALVAVAR